MISRSRTDFPVPLPPMRATSVPRFTLKLTPSWTVCAPKRVTTPMDLDDVVVARHQMPSSW